MRGRTDERAARRLAYKPGSVPRGGAVTVIYLGRRLPGGSSDLPEGRSGPDQPCPLIWSCSRWGLPSRPVTRPLVRSYIKAASARTFSPLPERSLRGAIAIGGMLSVALSRSFGQPFRAGLGRWALPTTASFGARTFLCRGGRQRILQLRARQRPFSRPASRLPYYKGRPDRSGVPSQDRFPMIDPGGPAVAGMAEMANHTIDWHDRPPAACRNGALAVGNFDGVHRGHAALIAALAAQARAIGGPAVALTFEPHPMVLLHPHKTPPPALTTTRERARLLHELGADQVVTLKTTSALLRLSAEKFFAEVVQQRFGARGIVEGPNFGFGRGRAGSVETLGRLCSAAGMALQIVPPIQVDGGEVSSSRIRAALQEGDVERANRLLGRPYRVHGMVGTGQRRGATLGFPTANLTDLLTMTPGDGVYAGRVQKDEAEWPAAINVGPNPTFGENARKVEAHLIGFKGDLYGQPLAVDFLSRLRATRPFGSAAELIEQLQRDVEQARIRAGRK